MPAYDSASPEPVQPCVIESASASTACQTCDSKFAYLLTGGVLGIITLIAIALTLLVFAALATSYTSYNDSPSDGWYERYGNGHRYDDHNLDDYFDWSDFLDETEGTQTL